MSLLSSSDIRNLLSISSQKGFDEKTQQGKWVNPKNRFLIFPYKEENLTPIGYDLTVGSKYWSLENKQEYELKPDKEFAIQNGETVLIMTEEYIGMPKCLSYGGIIQSKVSLVSKGLSPVSTTIDNDWEGRLLIAITNYYFLPIKLKRGDQFCTVMIFNSLSPADKGCGKPPGRLDIINSRTNEWMKEIKAKERFSVYIPAIIAITIIAITSIIGFILFNVTPGFPAMVSVGGAISVILTPLLEKIVKKRLI
jgi:deoxycytidine triphosphate deaminase